VKEFAGEKRKFWILKNIKKTGTKKKPHIQKKGYEALLQLLG